MSNFTLNTVLDSIKSDIQDVLRNLSQDEVNEMTASDVCNLLDENSYFEPEVIYYADGWEIVTGPSFNGYDAEVLNFSSCDNSLDLVMQEARGKVAASYYANREEIASDILDGLQNEPQD